MKPKCLRIDVMTMGGVKFYCSLQFPVCPFVRITPEMINAWVLEKRPLLKYESGVLVCYNYEELCKLSGI